MGRDIGYLPGDIEEKMRPWMQPLYDAIEMIRDIDRRSRQRSLPADILDSEEIGIEPLTYIRGRSIPCQYMKKTEKRMGYGETDSAQMVLLPYGQDKRVGTCEHECLLLLLQDSRRLLLLCERQCLLLLLQAAPTCLR